MGELSTGGRSRAALSTGSRTPSPDPGLPGIMSPCQREPRSQCHELLAVQADAIARRQGAQAGIDPHTMRSRVRSGRWQRLQRGVYAAFSGEPDPGDGALGRPAARWAGCRSEPPDGGRAARPDRRAKLSHHDHGPGITAPGTSEDPRRRHPPVRRDPADQAPGHAPAMHPGRGHGARPGPGRADLRRRVRVDLPGHRPPAHHRGPDTSGHGRAQEDALAPGTRRLALGDADDGALSVLEYRYVHRVERPHGLPAARRQARIRQRTGNRYLDNLYEEYGVCVELDGTAAHPADEQWRDKRRDNANAVSGIVTLRFGYPRSGRSLLRDRGLRSPPCCARAAGQALARPLRPAQAARRRGGLS